MIRNSNSNTEVGCFVFILIIKLGYISLKMFCFMHVNIGTVLVLYPLMQSPESLLFSLNLNISKIEKL